jgi:hypothetical protein
VVSSAFARELCLNYTFLLQHVFFSLCKLNCSSRTELIGSFIFGVVCCGLVNCIWVILFSLCFYFMVFMRWSVWILFGLCTVLIFFVACTWNLCDLLVVTSFVVA